MRFYPMRGTVLNYNFFVLCSVGIGAFFLTDLVCSIRIPGNHEDLNRPWRVWSGDPCQPCDIGSLIGNTFVRIGACRTPCFRNGTKACVPVGEYEFRCDCTDDYDGQFCEKPLWKERDVMLPLISSQNGNNITTGVIPIGNESDYLFQCNYPNGTNVQYELTYIQDYFRRRIRRGQLRCRNERFDNNFNDRCRDKNPDNSCQFCRSATNSSQSNHFDQYAFGNFVWDIYDGQGCENVVEIYIIYRNSLSSRIEQTIRDNVNCDERRVDEETYRGGCRLSTTSSSSKSSCIANLHMGHRCATCDRGLWGNKCQFAVEGKDGWNGCPDARYKKDGPCGIGGTLVQRPNGKFCVCPPGKVDGFVNVFEDRVKDGDCSPAGNETGGENDLVHFADKNSKYYKFFVGMSQFHTYYGCQINDPCQTFECKNNGTKEILDLIDEDSYGFKIVNFTRSRLSALEINSSKFKCGCNCAPGYEGEHCEHRNPCFFDKHYCQNLGICQRVDDIEKRCECVPPFGGSRCELVNPCQIQEVCDGPIRKCFPCKHGGDCNTNSAISPFSLSYEFSCDCTSISYVGERCEFAEGEIELRILSVDPMSIVVGSEEIYEILVRRKGDVPHIIVDVGDGFHFSVTENSLASTLGQADTTQDSPQAFFYKFTHTFTKEGQYLMRTFILNGDPNPNEKPEDIDVIYLAGQSFKNVTASLPIEFKCLPGARLINVASTVDESTQYTRKDAFTVEALLEPKCDQPFKFNYTWNLHKLDFLFPTPSADNNWHVNKVVTDVSQKYVNFKPRSLLNGRYVIDYVVNVQVNGLVRSNSAKGFFDIELNPPKIIVQGGLDRSVDVFQETVLDASNSIDESFPELSQQLSFVWHCDSPCKLQGSSGPWEGPVLTIPAESLTVGREYKFHLDVSTKNEDKKRSVMETIRLIGSTGSLQVQCIENCERLNPGAEMLVYCTCTSCPSPPVVQFTWEPFSDGVVPISKQNQSLAGIVLPNVVLGDQVSRAVVCKEVATNLISKLKVEINSPPSGGDCTIEPMHGVYLETPFNLNCQGFLDEDVPLQYSFYVTTDDRPGKDVENLLLLAHDTNPRASNVYLPYKPNGGDVVLVIRVTDNKELSTIRKLKVSVALPHAAEYPQLLRNLISGDESLMKRRKMFGDDQGAMQLQLVVLFGFLDNQFSELQPGEINELRMAISNVLAEVPLHSFKAVEQALESLFLLKQIDEEESLESLKESAMILFNGASRLAEYVLSDDQIISKENVLTIARDTADSARRILKSSYENGYSAIHSQMIQPRNERRITDFDSDDDIGRNYFFEIHELENVFEKEGDREVQENLNKKIQENAKISHHAYTALEHLLDAVGERLEDGKNFTLQAEDVTMYVDYDRKINTLGSTLELRSTLGKAIKLQMSQDFQNILESQGVSNVIVQVTGTYENPFFDDTTAIPGTPVVSLQVKDRTPGRERLPIHLEGLEEPFEFQIPLTSTSQDILMLSKSERSLILKPLNEIPESDLRPFHLILQFNTRVEITVEECLNDLQFSVVVLKDFWPTKQDFCNSTNRKTLSKANGCTTHFETETLGLLEEREEYFLEYYVAIFPYYPGLVHINDQLKYSVYFTRSSCLFRDEDSKFWSEGGCIIGNKTTASNLHCICNHASIFAGTQFAVPNDIPTLSIFDFSPEDFKRNPVVLITVCTLLCLYALGIILCWILDQRDRRRHVGITIMADLGDNFEHSYYLVTVLTGSRFGAGTTASLSLQVYGSKGRSEVYVLKEKTYPVLNRGGTDTFLVSSVKDLGELEKIRLWHDNYGSSPNWFCRKVIIQDVKSDREWYFFIDRWLEVTGTESTIIFEKNAATEKEHSKFSRRYRENVTDQFDNSHLWLSLFRRPAASRFTRCQRLSCAFAILTSYMMLNIMFYGIELDDIEDELGLQTYVYASQLTLLALPFGLILVLLFRRIRQRYLPTLIIWRNVKKTASESKEEASVFIPDKPRRDVARKSMGKSNSIFGYKNDFDIMAAGDDFRDDISDVLSNFSIPSTNVEDLESWLSQQEQDTQSSSRFLGAGAHYTRVVHEDPTSDIDQIGIGRMGLVHAVRAADPSSFIFPGGDSIPEMEYLIDDQIKSHFLKNVTSKPSENIKAAPAAGLPTKKESYMECDGDEELGALLQNTIRESESQNFKSSDRLDTGNDSNGEGGGLAFETCEMSPVKKAWCYLPWWFIFIAWMLCVGTILTCLYLTLLYGLHYGYLRSIDWLVGVTSSFVLSLLIIQPLNVVLTALGLTLCFRSKKSSEIQEERFQILLKDQDDLGYRKPFTLRVFHSERKHPPLSGHEIFKLKVEARGQEKIKNGLLKLIFYVFILIPLIIIAYGGYSSDNFLIVRNIGRLLKLSTSDSSALSLTNEIEVFDYLEHVFIPAVHPEELYNGARVRPQRFDPVFLADGQSLLLGVPRIRQLRVLKDRCDLPTSVDKSFGDCFGTYSRSSQDKEHYSPLWKPVTNASRSKSQTSNDVWKFNDFDSDFVRSLPLKGEIGLYEGGGYVAELGRRWRESSSVVRYLKRSRWIDHRTRAILIELTVVNPNVNIYADIVIIIERNPSQEFLTSYKITPVVLSSLEDVELTPWLNLSYTILTFAAIFLLVLFFWNIYVKKCPLVFTKLWFWLDLSAICGIVLSLLIALKSHFVVIESLQHIESMKVNQFVSLQLAGYWSQMSTAAFSISQCVCYMKIWRVLILIDERFLITSLTIKVTAKFLVAYFMVLLIILIAFASGGHFIFGREMEEFHTFSDSLISLIDQILSVNFFSELATTNRILGPLYSFVFGFFVVFLALNLLISLLNQGLHEGKQIARERCRRWTYGTYFATSINYMFAWNLFANTQTPLVKSRSLQPDRLEALQKITADFFREGLMSSVAQTFSNMKKYTNQQLQGTGYRVTHKMSRRNHEDIHKESRMVQMRLETGDFLRAKMGTEICSEELKDYAGLNRTIVERRIDRLQQKLAKITTAVDGLKQ